MEEAHHTHPTGERGGGVCEGVRVCRVYIPYASLLSQSREVGGTVHLLLVINPHDELVNNEVGHMGDQ